MMRGHLWLQVIRKTRINKESISKGLKLMAQEYPQHFLDAVTENDDAITVDVFFQCIVFNDVIYDI